MRLYAAVLLIVAPCIHASCAQTLVRDYTAPDGIETLDRRSPYLKAHLRDGGVYVLTDWRSESGSIAGHGTLLDRNRVAIASGEFTIAADSVVLFETNVVRNSGASTALTVMFGATAAVAVVCLTNPKACFGSCPTFYVPGPDGTLVLQAEGFSSSIAPALEATDVDMLYHARTTSRDFVVRVTNEALETHVIRHVDLRIARRPDGGRVLKTPDGEYRAAHEFRPPSACTAPEGNCRAALVAFDGIERWSAADSTDLAAREVVELVFADVPHRDAGLVITSRQTLMTTFLIYQALAFMGTDAGRWLTALETGGPAAVDGAAGIGRMLGGIEVLVQDGAGDWVLAGTVGETGPLASDTRVVPLPRSAAPLRVRLRMTRGLWRLEQAVLAELGPAIETQRIAPSVVHRDGERDDDALDALLDADATLVTMPGDAYDIGYRLPPDHGNYEVFLESRGYYLEWMREEWLAEEDPLMALRMVADPAGMLRLLAPAYKRGEADMEETFWGSRYVRH